MTEELTLEQKRSLLADHVQEAARLATEIAKDPGNDFGIDLGALDVPDFETARPSPEVQRAKASISAANAEIGTARTMAAVLEFFKSEFGLTI